MRESLMNCEFYGQSIEKQIPQKVWEPWLYTGTKSLICLRVMVMNPRNHPDSFQGSAPISK